MQSSLSLSVGHLLVHHRDPAQLIGFHELYKKVRHISCLNRPADVDWRLARIICWVVSCIRHKQRIEDYIVDVAIQISPTQLTWEITVSFLAEDNTITQLSERGVRRY